MRWREEQRRKNSYSNDGYRSDIIQFDETTEALRVALRELKVTAVADGAADAPLRVSLP